MGKRGRKRRSFPAHPAHPYNWGQVLILGSLRLLGRLPWRVGLRLGEALGGAGYLVARERRRIARRNLELCFPDKDAAAREALVRENFRATGRALAETGLAWYGGPKVDRIPVTVVGEEHVHTAMAAGHAVIAMSGHFLSVELCARLLPDTIPTVAIYKPMTKRPVLDRAMYRARRRNVVDALARDDIRGMKRAMKDGRMLWYAGDQDYGRRHSVFAPFFGVPAATVTALSRLSRMGRATVIPLFFFREGDGSYRIEFQPPMDGFPSGDDLADATHMNRTLEEAIRRYPEQYLWMHQRFKRRERKGDDLYGRRRR